MRPPAPNTPTRITGSRYADPPRRASEYRRAPRGRRHRHGRRRASPHRPVRQDAPRPSATSPCTSCDRPMRLMRPAESSRPSSIEPRSWPLPTASSCSVVPSAAMRSQMSSTTLITSLGAIRRGARVDPEHPRVGERGDGTSTRSTPGPAPRGPPGTAGWTCPRRARCRPAPARSGRGRRDRWRATPTAMCTCSVGRSSRHLGPAAGRRRADALAATTARRPRGEPAASRVDHAVVVDGAGRGHDHVGGPVVVGEEGGDLVAGHRRRWCPRRRARPDPSGWSGYSASKSSSCARSAGSSPRMRISSRMTWRSASTSSGRKAGRPHDVAEHVERRARGRCRAPGRRRPCTPWW